MKKWFLSLAALIVLVIAVLSLVNLIDAPLKPETAALLQVPAPSASDLKAYKYYLGILAPDDQDPADTGQSLYENRKAFVEGRIFADGIKPAPKNRLPVSQDLCKGFCENDDFARRRPQLQGTVAEHAPLLRRFDRWMEFGRFATDETIYHPVGLPGLLELFDLKFSELNLLLREKKERQVLDQLLIVGDFASRSIAGQRSLLLRHLVMLQAERVKEFAEKAARENVAFHKLLTPKVRARFVYDLPEDEATLAAAAGEMSLMPAFLRVFREEPLESDEWLRGAIRKVMTSIFFQEHRTLNQVADRLRAASDAPCVKSGETCPELSDETRSWVNPLGANVARLVAVQPKFFQRLNRRLTALRTPFKP